MRVLWFILISVIAVPSLNGQDKKARNLLDKVSKYYMGLSSVSIDFDLTVQFPEEEATTYPSNVVQQDNRFLFKNSEQEYYGNGEDIWIYIVAQNEVQINDFEEEDAEDYFITPLDLLNQYESGKYDYQISGKKGSTTDVEFKPKDEYSDFSKFRISINTNTNKVSKILGFGKDGSRITIDIKKVIENETYANSIFEFDKSNYPGVRVEDLRL